MAKPHYNERSYRNARAWLTANPNTLCWHDDCMALATTIDHVPAIAEHTHRPDTRCCELRPACHHCNTSHGATMGNAKRSPTSRAW